MARRIVKTWLAMVLLVVATGCAALQPTTPDGPRSNQPPYPIVATEVERLDAARLAWRELSQLYGVPENTEANFEPLTSTLLSLPANAGSSIVLPQVGDGPTPTEEDIRESLRRFIVEWKQLIGAEPAQLSLVERSKDRSGVELARYEQRPFRYPLRGDFGNLIIRFRPDRTVVGLSSNCLPNTDRLQATLLALTPKITREDIPTLLTNNTITVLDSAGRQQTFTLSNTDALETRQLVVYARTSPGRTGVALYLAWEIGVTNGPIKTIYLDAIDGKVIS